jgi:hypothetical protein
MGVDAAALERGARNLLVNCAGAKPGESLLILHEDSTAGYFGPDLAEDIARLAEGMGLHVTMLETPFAPDVDTLTPQQEAAVKASDHALFLARLGDQLRFKAMPAGSRPVVSYVLDRDALASDFGTAAYEAFAALKAAFNTLFLKARRIRVTCPLGSDFGGAVTSVDTGGTDDVTIKRYPMSVFAPLDARGFSGRVAVAHLLVGTGSRYYQPYGVRLEGVLFAHIADGQLQRWQGEAAEVQRAEAHYSGVAQKFGIDGGSVHSWHAGIHPGCAFTGCAHDQYERWSGSAFGNPRLLHFHTCGTYAPGEICWNIVDPTIDVDGVRIWESGRIQIELLPGADTILADHPEVRALFERPEQRIGLDVAA